MVDLPPATAPFSPAAATRLGASLAAALRRDPDAEIIRTDDRLLTRADLERASYAVAHRCVAAGAVPGTWVVLLLPQGADAMIGYLAATRTGAGVASIDPRRGAAEIERLLARLDAKVAVTDDTWAPLLTSLGVTPVLVDPVDVDADPDALGPLPTPRASDPASLAFTSGSGGRPKGVLRLHEDRGAPHPPGSAKGPGDRLLVVSPFGPPAALVSLLRVIHDGGVLLPFDLSSSTVTDLLAFARRHRVDALRIPPGVYRAMVDALGPQRLDDVRAVVLSGEALLVSDYEALGRCFAPDAVLEHSYGLTETTSLARFRFQVGDLVPKTTGRFPEVLPGIRLSIEGPAGEPLPPGTLGEIVVRARVVAHGYLDDPELTAERFFTDPDGLRGFRTGDLGRFAPDGALEVAGRADDQVKVRGHAVRVGEVEEALRRLPGVGECAVVAVPDERDGVKLVAFVVGSERVPPTVGELRRGMAAAVPPFMVPAGFRTLTVLPRLPEGKLDRQRLAADGAQSLPRSVPYRRPMTGTERIIRNTFCHVLGFERREVGCDDDFFELGGNSLSAMELLALLERDVAVRFDVPTLIAHPTVSGLAAQAERGLRHRDAAGRDRFLHIAGTADGPAVVLYPGTADSVLHIVPLARRLGSEVHARLARGLDEPSTGRARHSQVLAEEAALLASLPPGPLVLGGHSAGGILAVELAARLRAAGREVPLVVLIDTVNPGSPWRRLTVRIASRGGTVPMGEARFTVGALAGAILRRARRVVTRRPVLPTGPARPQPAAAAPTDPMAELRAQRDRLFLEAADRSLLCRLPTYDGEVLLVVATRAVRDGGGLGPDLGWGRLVRGGLTVVGIDGDHTSILEPPDVDRLAVLLREHLVKAGLLVG